uniref:Capsid protein n=1 Tax=Cygnus atratus Chaphamaparvovirus TaxID=2794485 RepID=A0A8A4XE84_9VIRU|nr:MAG: capsid protein [Cygnus atratus Chaphamaparvovirus]
MTETIAFQNVYMTYIDNNPYKYPSIDVETIVEGTNLQSKYIETGWHIIPNFLFRHALIPRQWASLVTNCESYAVKEIKGVIYNPIPITTNLSLQRINTFSAFNNCTYALTYSDNKYETSWFPWYDLARNQQLHLAHREGLIWYGDQQEASEPQYGAKRYQWPVYVWHKPRMRTAIDNVWSQGKLGQAGVWDTDATIPGEEDRPKQALPGGIFWDPFNCPDEIGELRAGKNSISFNWKPADIDANKFFNLDMLASFAEWTTDGPFCGEGRPGQFKRTLAMDPDTACTFGLAEKMVTTGTDNVTNYDDYTIPNMYNMPIMPTKWFWHEIGKSIVDTAEESEVSGSKWTHYKLWRKADKYWPGTEWESAKYPPEQWFCKGIPLYDSQNEHIKTTTQVSFQITLVLEGKKRRSAYFAPTHGPWSGDQLYYHTNKRGIFQTAAVRYKTGGARRTWQNIQASWKISNQNPAQTNRENLQQHPRLDPYLWGDRAVTTLTQACYNAQHRPVGISDGSGHNKTIEPEAIKVTWSRDTDSTTIHMDTSEPTVRSKKTLFSFK